jgi:ABC-type glycerol-3-phosphate transport system substrate-binding protein
MDKSLIGECMRYKTKFLYLCIVLAAMLAACYNGTNKSGNLNSAESTESHAADQMIVYCDPGDLYISDAVKEFNSIEKRSPVNIKEFNYSTQTEETKNKLISDLLAGDGPDIIFAFNSLFPKLRKTCNSGVFLDLNSLIKNDKDFKLTDYNQNVINSGIVDNKRCMLPICYRLPSIWTTKNILKSNDIHISDSKLTWKEFFNEAKKYMDKHAGEAKYFTGNFFEPSYIMEDICGELVDCKNKVTRFNTKEFINFLKKYKEINPAICQTDEINKKGTVSRYLDSNSIVAIGTGGYIAPNNVFEINSVLKKELNQDVMTLNYPSIDDRQIKSAYPERMIGINSKCRSQEKAFEFVKLLLSEKYQERTDIQGIPVNIKGYRDLVAKYSDESAKFIELGSTYVIKQVNGIPLPASVLKNTDEVINNINNCQIIDYSIVEIASYEVTEYLKGKSSAEETAKAIDDKVKLYINE